MPSGGGTKKKGENMQYKFVQLLLVLAKRRIAITWMGTGSPQLERWVEM